MLPWLPAASLCRWRASMLGRRGSSPLGRARISRAKDSLARLKAESSPHGPHTAPSAAARWALNTDMAALSAILQTGTLHANIRGVRAPIIPGWPDSSGAAVHDALDPAPFPGSDTIPAGGFHLAVAGPFITVSILLAYFRAISRNRLAVSNRSDLSPRVTTRSPSCALSVPSGSSWETASMKRSTSCAKA